MSPKGTGADTRRISDAEIALEVGAAAFRPISSQALSGIPTTPGRRRRDHRLASRAANSSLSIALPRKIHVFTVPSGSPVRSAIWS
jgi:hypothetical protein